MTATTLDFTDTLQAAQTPADIRTGVDALPQVHGQLVGRLEGLENPRGLDCSAITRVQMAWSRYCDLSDRLEPDPDELDLTAPFDGYLSSHRRVEALPSPVHWLPGSAAAANAPDPCWRYLRAHAGYAAARADRSHAGRNRARDWARLRDNAAGDALAYWSRFTTALSADLAVFSADLAALQAKAVPIPQSTNRRGNHW